MLTKNGKPRLGPLNISQLTKMLDGARKKNVAKIKRAIAKRLKTQTIQLQRGSSEVEHWTHNPGAVGSIPSPATNKEIL